jgi:putative polyketide hydroxylase
MSTVVSSFDGAARTSAGARTEPLGAQTTCDVLIVGAGPVGLTLGILLQRSLINAVVIERHSGVSIHPKARGVFPRTMEVFRQIGVAHDLADIGRRVAGDHHYVTMAPTLASPDYDHRLLLGPDDDFSNYSEFNAVLGSQDVVERLLLRRARFEHLPIHFRSETTDIVQDDDGVTATVVHRDTNTTSVVRAKYLVGCDGSNSFVRSQMGIAFEGHGDLASFINVLFEADLAHLVADHRSVGYQVTGPLGRGSFLTVDNARRWLYNFEIEPGTADTYNDERLRKVLATAIGEPADVTIVSAVDWAPAAKIASRYREGRVFLAGDAARVVPPNGAMGMNCGIQDAYNLGWKLAGAVTGNCSPSVLDTYEVERRPIGERTMRFAFEGHMAMAERAAGAPPGGPPPGAMPRQPLGLTLGYTYASTAVIDDDEDPAPDPDDFTFPVTGRPGERTPHLRMRTPNGPGALSSMVGPGWSVFAGPNGGAWGGAIPFVPANVIGPPMDADNAFCSTFGVDTDGVVLVRPDNVIAWRQRSWKPDGHERLRAAHARARGL